MCLVPQAVKAEENNEFLAAKDAEGKSSAAQEIGKAADAEPRDALPPPPPPL